MILQTLDIKNNCRGIFHRGSFLFDFAPEIIDSYSLAWKHSPLLNDENFQYLFLRLKTDDLSTYAPNPILYETYQQNLHAQARAAATAKIELEEECFFDLLPKHQLIRWFETRSQALQSLSGALAPSEDYEILHKAHVLATEISHQDLIFKGEKTRVLYNIFGSSTGRLTTTRNSAPVLTLRKEQRTQITPQNDAFVELDLNAAEVRTLIALTGLKQPQGDIHEWVATNVFSGSLSRSEAKTKLFAWLYNPSDSKTHFDKFFSRTIFRDFFTWEDQMLETPFGRKLSVDERKAQNYLLQSTTSDIVIQNAYKIMKMLKGRKSQIAFTLHDSIVIDMSREDITTLREIKEQFEETPWGPFRSTCKIGKNFGNLRDLQL